MDFYVSILDENQTTSSPEEVAFYDILTTSYLLIYITIFPFFVHVFRLNQKRDQATAIFPILSHFFVFLKWNTIVFLIAATFLLANKLGLNSLLGALMMLIGILQYPIATIAVEVNQMLLSLLAIQRFSIYFFPDTEPYLNVSQKTFKYIIGVLYGLFVLEELLAMILLALGFENLGKWIFWSFYTSLNIILLCSFLLYIPIIYSIRKFAYLASAQLNKPQRYVLWQLVVIVAEKMIYLPVIYYSSDSNFTQIILSCRRMDSYMIILVLQATYLGCNRQTLRTLIGSMRGWNFLRVMCCTFLPHTKVTPTATAMAPIFSVQSD